jgi:hypothetical protein
MSIIVNDQDALDPFSQRVARRNRCVIEYAKTHRTSGLGMVTGRADNGECVPHLPIQDSLRTGQSGACRQQGVHIGSRCYEGGGRVDDRRSTLMADMFDRRDPLMVMYQGNLLRGGRNRPKTLGWVNFEPFRQKVQPRRALRVVGIFVSGRGNKGICCAISELYKQSGVPEHA